MFPPSIRSNAAPDAAAIRGTPGRIAPRQGFPRSGISSSGRRWPCVLPSIAVTIVPLRNLTGDADQHDLVEAFTDRLVANLVRHSRGLSFARTADERSAVANLAPKDAPDLEYVVAGSAQRGSPGMLRVNMRISDAATAEYLWADRYEFRPEDLPSIQTKINRQISRELHILLLEEASHCAFISSGVEHGVNE